MESFECCLCFSILLILVVEWDDAILLGNDKEHERENVSSLSVNFNKTDLRSYCSPGMASTLFSYSSKLSNAPPHDLFPHLFSFVRR